MVWSASDLKAAAECEFAWLRALDAKLGRIPAVEEPEDEMLEELGVDDAFDLTGLYDGIPLTEKSTAEQMTRPDVVWLFRRPILDEWCERGDVGLAELIAHVLIHEIGHHFGLSDDDIHAIEDQD